MLDIRIDDVHYKTVKSMFQLCYEIGKFIFIEKNQFFTLLVHDNKSHTMMYIDGDIFKAFK